jgi:hypothetical protein
MLDSLSFTLIFLRDSRKAKMNEAASSVEPEVKTRFIC